MVQYLPSSSLLAQTPLEGWTLFSFVSMLSGCCSTSWCIPQGDEVADRVLETVLPQLLGCHHFLSDKLLFTVGMTCLGMIFSVAFHTLQLSPSPGNPLVA